MLHLSRKHILLFRSHCDLEQRLQNGEEIPFNFACNARRLPEIDLFKNLYNTKLCSFTAAITTTEAGPSHHTSYQQTFASKSRDQPFELFIESQELVAEAHSDDEYEEQPSKKKQRKPRAAPCVGKRKNKRQDSSHGDQSECCLIGCHNTVTNRLRFSLRCHKPEDFKDSFISVGWNKVCTYHYFSDLYKYKKMTHGAQASVKGSRSQKKKAAPKRKRTQVDDEDSYEEDADYSPVTKKKKNDDEDVSLFYNFIVTNQPQE